MTKWKYDYDIFISIINDNVVLTPYIRGPDDLYDLKVYLNSDEISEIQSKIKWKDSLSDKIPLGSDPLIEYLLKDLPEKENLDIYSDVYLLPIPIDQTNIQDIRNEYLDDIISFRSQGYFSIKLNIDTRDIVYDLFKLFEVPIVHETENYIF